jgi:hypothetical protein
MNQLSSSYIPHAPMENFIFCSTQSIYDRERPGCGAYSGFQKLLNTHCSAHEMKDMQIIAMTFVKKEKVRIELL